MFTKSNRMTAQEGASVNLVASGTRISGEIQSNSDLRIDGHLIGNLNVKGKLVVGNSGKIEGEVECQNADISGEIKGKITVSELLMLRATSRVNGDIFTSKLAIEPDAQFSGACGMGGIVKSIQQGSDERNESAPKKAIGAK